MENIRSIMAKAEELRDFASARGHALIMARGCELKLYKSPDECEIEETRIGMKFQENTPHDCPDFEFVSLSIDELEMSEPDWANHIDSIIEKTKTEKARKQSESDARQLERDKKEFDRLCQLLKDKI